MSDEQKQKTDMEVANEPAHYKTIVFGLVICMIGSYLRFAFDSVMLSTVSLVILFIGAFICCKAVFKILVS